MTGPSFLLSNQARHVYCAAQHEPENGWIRLTWSGFVINDDGVQGASSYLRLLQGTPCSRLLNDNSRVTGPWFDSIDWLEHVWAPQVVALGLRYVAHVLPANDFPSVLPPADTFAGLFELQIFTTVAEAEQWLRSRGAAHSAEQVA
ncbi:hypothetical protein [Hymenobacter chitinivorans]|uniref:SpoIIAA-like protein n=1 Tax=Hymenobacter chitinivorans DSM 11115 TaxID=1121954 RepID=A0A2M9BQA5_9BACT|nr:hypothetical protein [Hymenobacter chitinivorans]PJJ60135.1 hypothetical protein CLV45_1560 [Hymenobacter chitinivorans DSM 11115]